MTKVCVQCKAEKPREEYYSRGDGTARIQAKCKACCAANAHVQREWRAKNPERAKDYELRRTHGMTLAQYEVLLEQQHGVCAICFRPPGTVGTGNNGTGTLAVDHCHQSGVVRGLLCTNCNLGIGSFFNSPEALDQAARYLREFHVSVIGQDLPEAPERLRRVPEALRKNRKLQRPDQGPELSVDDMLQEMINDD